MEVEDPEERRGVHFPLYALLYSTLYPGVPAINVLTKLVKLVEFFFDWISVKIN